MTRPKVYFSSMTTEEVLSYASQYAETELEKALAENLKPCLEYEDSLESEESLSRELNDAGEDLASAIRDIIYEEDDDVIGAVELYEKRVSAAYVKYQKG